MISSNQIKITEVVINVLQRLVAVAIDSSGLLGQMQWHLLMQLDSLTVTLQDGVKKLIT